jgi:hypothetical protein
MAARFRWPIFLDLNSFFTRADTSLCSKETIDLKPSRRRHPRFSAGPVPHKIQFIQNQNSAKTRHERRMPEAHGV